MRFWNHSFWSETRCVDCNILKHEVLVEKEKQVIKQREINRLDQELKELKTAIRILMRSVDY